jgi:hypothetical protein
MAAQRIADFHLREQDRVMPGAVSAVTVVAPNAASYSAMAVLTSEVAIYAPRETAIGAT